ncbi:MAG TPA: DciA family protein [Tepidisphaeraceae bacterium]|nr:DciA family protein [Tepidisphaeraceae bacterium]
MRSREEAELVRLARVKHRDFPTGQPLGPEMVQFFKNSVARRHTKLGKIGECWAVLVPETLLEHCSLEGYTRGTLTVLVDSSPHLYELKQLLLAGLEDQLLLACKSAGLRKINLRAGRWYEEQSGDRKVNF